MKVPQINGSFYVLIRNSRGKILKTDLVNFFSCVKSVSNKAYDKYSRKSNMFCYKYFPCFKHVKCHGSYHYHFLVIRKNYQRWVVIKKMEKLSVDFFLKKLVAFLLLVIIFHTAFSKKKSTGDTFICSFATKDVMYFSNSFQISREICNNFKIF